MDSTNFAYWAQGYFEIDGNCTEINEKRLNIIKAHLELVFKYDKEPSKFCHWVKGFLAGNNEKSLNSERTAIFIKELNSVFKHEIDPSYTSDVNLQQEMNQIHNSGKNEFPYGEGVRC